MKTILDNVNLMFTDKKQYFSKFIIYGQLYSKSNNRQLTKGRNIKSAGALSWQAFALKQLKGLKKCFYASEAITENISLTAFIYYPDNRSDLDESLLMDVLEKSKLIKNDRQIKEKHIFHRIDKKSPRCEIVLKILV